MESVIKTPKAIGEFAPKVSSTKINVEKIGELIGPGGKNIKKITELSGAAVEPEIMDLIAILQKMGAIISVDTDRVIRIEGVATLNGYSHRALFDRNEAASWAARAVVATNPVDVDGQSKRTTTASSSPRTHADGTCDISSRLARPGR
jgi:polyribonucleotide nucleotidyltransferase